MKRKLLWTLGVGLWTAATAVAYDHVRWTFADFTDANLTIRRVNIQPLYTWTITGTNFNTGDRRTYTNTATGTLLVSNIVAGSYAVEFVGPYRSTWITNTFWGTNGLIDAKDYTSVSTVTGFASAYSQAVADLRFVRSTNGNATNLTIRGLTMPVGAVANYVWTATNTSGAGTWQPVSTALSGSNAYNGSFTGSGAALTNLQNLTWKTVSGKGVANGLSAIRNNGKDFGPDTTGTATSGLQEAIDSFARGAGDSTNIVVALDLDGGVLAYTNTLFYSNHLSYQLFIKGQGFFGTTLLYAGTTAGTNGIYITGGGRAGATIGLPGYVQITDLTISALHGTTNVLLRTTNCNYVKLARVNLSSWKTNTMEDWFKTVDDDGGASFIATNVGLVGAVLGNDNDGEVYIEDCQAGFLAVGLDIYTDHFFMQRFIGVINGKPAGAGVGGEIQLAWPASHKYRLGASVMRRPGLETHILWSHFYDDKLGIGLLNYTGTHGDIINLRGTTLEGNSPAVAAIVTNGNVWTIDDYGEGTGGGLFSTTQQGRINTNDWTVTQAPLTLQGLVYNNPAYIVGAQAVGGFNLRSGIYTGNAAGLTNVPGGILTNAGSGLNNTLSNLIVKRITSGDAAIRIANYPTSITNTANGNLGAAISWEDVSAGDSGIAFWLNDGVDSRREFILGADGGNWSRLIHGLQASEFHATNTATAGFTGNGAGLTNLNAANLTGYMNTTNTGPVTNYHGIELNYPADDGSGATETMLGSTWGFWGRPPANGQTFGFGMKNGEGYRTNIIRLLFLGTNANPGQTITGTVGQGNLRWGIAARRQFTGNVSGTNSALSVTTPGICHLSFTNYEHATARQTNNLLHITVDYSIAPPATNYQWFIGAQTEWYP